MVNEIIDGLSVTLSEAFNGVTIYSESILQGFNEPCFFILNLTSEETRLLGNRAKRNMSFDIHYFPESKTAPKEECHRVAETLYPLLRQITLLDGSKLLGLGLNYEVVDGVLHFYIEFKPVIRYMDNVPIENMETIEVTEGVKV